jgi:hypothetical protein
MPSLAHNPGPDEAEGPSTAPAIDPAQVSVLVNGKPVVVTIEEGIGTAPREQAHDHPPDRAADYLPEH